MFFLIYTFLCSAEKDVDWEAEEDKTQATQINWSSLIIHDVIIIGNGPAGNTAALYAAKAGLSPVVLCGNYPGGQISRADQIHNFPTFKGNGTELAKSIEEQAISFGAKFLHCTIASVDLKTSPKKLLTDENEGFLCNSVIIATGAEPRRLGLESEERLMGNGISTCAHCDGSLFTNKFVVVVGGGNTACYEALYLSKICSRVVLITHGKIIRAGGKMLPKLKEAGIDVITNSIVTNITGFYSVSGIQFKNTETNEIQSLCCNGVFVAIGQKPATSLFSKQLKINKNGFIVTDGSTRTNIQGVFAAGDCTDTEFKQAITAAADGCKASILVEKFLKDLPQAKK